MRNDWPDSPGIMIAGAVHVDEVAIPRHALIPRSSNAVSWQRSAGGVAANVARAVARVRAVWFVAAVGRDAEADLLGAALKQSEVNACLVPLGQSTGRYSAIMDRDGELHIGLADVALAEDLSMPDITRVYPYGRRPAALIVDANLSPVCLRALRAFSLEAPDCPFIAMAVSPAKVRRLDTDTTRPDILFLNRREAEALNGAGESAAAPDGKPFGESASLDTHADALQQRGFECFVLTDGPAGVLIQEAGGRTHLPVPTLTSMISVNGGGDALAGATIAAWMNRTDSSTTDSATGAYPLAEAVRDAGLPAAALVLCGGHPAPQLDTIDRAQPR